MKQSFRQLFGLFICGLVFTFGLPSMADAAMTQNDYRLYANTNNQTPTDPWPIGGVNLGENAAATMENGIGSNEIFRIRMSINVSTTNESGHDFKLQYKEGVSCSGGGTWFDVGAPASGTIWRGVDNGAVTDGSTLTSTLLTASDVAQTYEEQNNTATMPAGIDVGQDGEWDWVVQNNGANQGATYCFRMVKSGGETLNGYNDYPTVETKLFAPESKNWRWYEDAQNVTPGTPMEPENLQALAVREVTPLKLRMSIAEVGGEPGVDRRIRLQYSSTSNFSSDVGFVTEIGSCTTSSVWCYADGGGTDDAVLAAILLTDSSVAATHNESGIAASTYDHSANTTAEYEFTIQSQEAVSEGVVYYFRAYDETSNFAIPLGPGESYPKAKTFATMLSFSIAGLNSGAVIDGYTTDVSTTATSLPFGTLVPGVPVDAAQRLTVSTDGEEYSVYVVADGQLRTVGAEQIPGISGTNSTPSPWGFDVDLLTTGAFGYHPDDDQLSGGSTRFQANDTWAQIDGTAREVFYGIGPIDNATHDIIYRVEISSIQPAGSYVNEIQYVVIPAY